MPFCSMGVPFLSTGGVETALEGAREGTWDPGVDPGAKTSTSTILLAGDLPLAGSISLGVPESPLLQQILPASLPAARHFGWPRVLE